MKYPLIENLPNWIEILFLLTWLSTVTLFYFANGKPKLLIASIVIWSIIHSILAYTGFYTDTQAMPPRFGLILIPVLIIIAAGLRREQVKKSIAKRKIRISTFLHCIRLPVEIVLYQLFLYGMIPGLMTFEGRNFDILLGITAPIIAVLLINKKIGAKALLIWNTVGLCSVLFIFFNGIFSAELPLQLFGFEQPNRAISYFPFVLLPATIVPIVIWAHIVDIIFLIKKPVTANGFY